MAFSDTFLDELIARNDIVSVVSGYTTLTKRGGRYFGLCPFHNEKTPSFTVTPGKDLYYCFGCGKGGGVISFIMEQEGLSFPDAVQFLARRAGMTVPEENDDGRGKLRKRLLDLNRQAAIWYRENLGKPEGQQVVELLKRRKILPKTAARFGLGAAPDSWDSLIKAMTAKGFTKQELLEAGLASEGKNGGIYDRFRNKLMFPVIDVKGDILGFGSRVLDNSKPKYINSPDTPVYNKRKNLYGIHLAKNTKRQNIILCEGNIDVLTLHQAGFDNAVAAMGTALTVEQTKLIGKYVHEIVLCYDNDGAGLKAAQRSMGILGDSEISIRVLRLPDKIENGERVKVDVDDFIKANGPDAFERLLAGSENDTEYRLSRLREGYDLTDDAQKVEYLRKAGQLIAALKSPVEREVYISRQSELTGVPAAAMRLEVERSRKGFMKSQKKKEERQSLSPAVNAQPKNRELRYTNVRSAVAEEGMLRIAAQDAPLLLERDLSPEEFTSPTLGKAYKVFLDGAKRGVQAGMASLAAVLTTEETALVAGILSESLEGDRRQAMNDYIAVIRKEHTKQAAAQSEEGLMAAFESYKDKKSYGG